MALENFLVNNFDIVGRIINSPIKISENDTIKTIILIRTSYNKKFVEIPVTFYGLDTHIVVTKFRQGDLIAVRGCLYTEEVEANKLEITFVGEEFKLLKKTHQIRDIEDKFRKIVKLYDKEEITKDFVGE